MLFSSSRTANSWEKLNRHCTDYLVYKQRHICVKDMSFHILLISYALKRGLPTALCQSLDNLYLTTPLSLLRRPQEPLRRPVLPAHRQRAQVLPSLRERRLQGVHHGKVLRQHQEKCKYIVHLAAKARKKPSDNKNCDFDEENRSFSVDLPQYLGHHTHISFG